MYTELRGIIDGVHVGVYDECIWAETVHVISTEFPNKLSLGSEIYCF